MQKNRVAITGIGLVTPLGQTTSQTWQAIQKGVSGLTPYSLSGYKNLSAGLVGDVSQKLNEMFPAKYHDRSDRFIHLAVIAGHQAMINAGLSKTMPENRDRFGASLGVGIGGLETIGQACIAMLNRGGKGVNPFTIPKAVNNMAPSWLTMLWDLRGHCVSLSSACSSSSDAIGYAFRTIRDGYADYMLTGGSEACVLPVAMASFANMRALSRFAGPAEQSCRPFDSKRSGFVMGEGAGVLLLERLDLARARGATVYAELVGYGATADAFHITAMQPDGRGAQNAMRAALADAQLEASQIDYINAHGTGTLMNDVVETAAIKKVFGEHADVHYKNHVQVSSTKSMTGHSLGAAGGVEAGIAALALHDGVVPPTINLDEPDGKCDLDYVANVAQKRDMKYAMSNSFGFGGGNVSLVFAKG